MNLVGNTIPIMHRTTNTATSSPWYTLANSAYDEMLDEHGTVRPHWNVLVQAMEGLGSHEVGRRHREILKLLRENGVTYNVYGDPDGSSRPWQLDPIPMLLSNTEWSDIEAGLLERAELLNLILTDIYGTRELVRKGLLPLDLLYNHGGFLRACDKVKLPGAHQLILYAADLARGTDGRMWVLGDRTQAPSGAGYALENRLAMSRVLPSLFRDASVHRLERFFQSLRSGLEAIAPPHAETPRIVVLTPGSLNETFFEHAYLASYLGYPLVQGADLTVRDGYVWLKSLSGLQRVDVILRRIDDNFCDPLELDDYSRLGISGLLEVARRGNVAIANPLGSSVLENPGLLPFLPGIAKHFLGRELRLPSAATWWCGQPRELEYVLANLHELVIKPTYRGLNNQANTSSSVFGYQLSQQELSDWRDRIRANPTLYVGQEHESFSTMPSVVAGGYEPRQALLRCFMVASSSGYTAMPGGLTRSAPHTGDMPVSNQLGAISKDTWVVSTEPETSAAAAQDQKQAIMHGNYTSALPSRVADNLYWVGRYAERAEGTVRLLRATVKKIYINPDRHNLHYEDSLYTLLQSLTTLTNTYPGYLAEDNSELLQAPEAELLSVALEEKRSGSIANTLHNLVEVGYAVRDLWSADTWRVIDDLERHLGQAIQPGDASLSMMQEHCNQLVTALTALSGLIMESMTRGNGWLFLDLGRRLERALLLISLLRSCFSTAQPEGVEILLLESLLDTSDNLICYRQHYRNNLELPSFLELLLLDGNNPRSLAYQIARIQEHVSKLPRERKGQRLSAEERLALEAHSLIGLASLEKLIQISPENLREHLDQTLSRLYYLLVTLSDTITSTYFQHGELQHSLSASKPIHPYLG